MTFACVCPNAPVEKKKEMKSCKFLRWTIGWPSSPRVSTSNSVLNMRSHCKVQSQHVKNGHGTVRMG